MSKNLTHYTSSNFWQCYHKLPLKIQKIADKQYQLLKQNPQHPSLNLKLIGDLWSVRVTKNYRALGTNESQNILWFWIALIAESELRSLVETVYLLRSPANASLNLDLS